MTHPDNDDVVVRQKRRTPIAVYLLGTPSAPDQLMLRTFDEAVSQALAFATHAHVAAWFTNDEDDFVLLGTFREDKVEPARSSSWRSQQEEKEVRQSSRLPTVQREC